MAIIFLCLPAIAKAQQYISLYPNVHHESDSTSHQRKRAEPDISPSDGDKDALSNNPRLDVLVTLIRRRTTVSDVLAELTTVTKVKLRPADKEIGTSPISLSFHETTLRTVLHDVLALHANYWQWQRTQDKNGEAVLLLCKSYNEHRWDFLHPHTQDESDMENSVAAFLGQSRLLPPDLQQALMTPPHRSPPFTNGGVPVSSLPEAMQQTLRDGLEASRNWYASRGVPGLASLSPDDLGQATVCLSLNAQDGLAGGKITLSGRGTAQFGLSVPAEKVMPDDRNMIPDFSAGGGMSVIPDADSASYRADEKALLTTYTNSRKKAIETDPHLRTLVSLHFQDETEGFVLSALSQQEHFNVIAQRPPSDPHHTIDLRSLSLKDALDDLAVEYHAMWGCSKDGTILFHYRLNDGVVSSKLSSP